MSGKQKLLSEIQRKELYFNYHEFIKSTILKNIRPKWLDFYVYLRQKDNLYAAIEDKQISNKIIDYRKIYGKEIWPSLNQVKKEYTFLGKDDLEVLYNGDLSIIEEHKNPKDTFKDLVDSIFESIQGNDSIKGLINKNLLRVRDIECNIIDLVPFTKEIETTNKKKRKESIDKLTIDSKQLKFSTDRDFQKSITTLYEYISDIYQSNQKIRTNQTKVVIQSLFLNLFSILDAFTGEILEFLYRKRPEILNSSSKQYSITQIIEFESKEDIFSFLIEEEIDSLRRESYIKQIENMEKRFNITLKDFENWPNFVEITQRRNLIMHCDGKISKQYLTLCEENRVRSDKNAGDYLNVDLEYLLHSVELIKEVIFKLGQTLWRKVFVDQIEEANIHDIDTSFDMLVLKNWKFASMITEFGLKIPKTQILSDAYRKVVLINNCIALSELGESENITEKSYLVWPLFNTLRQKKEFANIYKEIYEKDFIQQVELGLDGLT
jgi:hypothetical protein